MISGYVDINAFHQKGEHMFIPQSDLFKDLDEQTMAEISRIMVEQAYKTGDVIYTEKTKAEKFYVLWEGRVKLAIGTEAEIDYTVSNRGQVFGWSSLIDRARYTARAQCVESAKVYAIDKEKIEKIFANRPESGKIFYRNLTAAVVQRLVDTYNAFLTEGSLRGITSFGTGQVMQPGED
jgi:CRP-like cAMP-binding protein